MGDARVSWPVQATLTLSPFLVNKLNKLGADLYGTNGRQNVPSSTADFLQRLKDILSSAPLNPKHIPAYTPNPECISGNAP